jgi:hypothetical protein
VLNSLSWALITGCLFPSRGLWDDLEWGAVRLDLQGAKTMRGQCLQATSIMQIYGQKEVVKKYLLVAIWWSGSFLEGDWQPVDMLNKKSLHHMSTGCLLSSR